MTELQRAIRINIPSITDLARRVQIIVVDGQIANGVREADGEFSGGVIVAEEDVGEGISALLGGVELLDECGGVVREPGFCDGLAAGEDDHGGNACVDDCFDEGGLGADEAEAVYVDVFAGSRVLC